jgi:dipeptidyl aminopeptidase/acylaminoacyl peptidase
MDDTVRVWDVATGKQLALLQGHTGPVWSVAFSPDGARLATASNDGTARVWDAATGKPLALLQGHTGQLWSVAFSPDGTRLATASSDGTARVWDAASGRQLVSLQGHTASVVSVAFSPDGSRLATASADGTARLWIAQEAEAAWRQRSRICRDRQAEDAAKAKDWFAAAFLLRQLIREEPNNPDLYLRRALVYREQGKRDEARKDQARAVQLAAPLFLPAR